MDSIDFFLEFNVFKKYTRNWFKGLSHHPGAECTVVFFKCKNAE